MGKFSKKKPKPALKNGQAPCLIYARWFIAFFLLAGISFPDPGRQERLGSNAAEAQTAINIAGLWESNTGWKYSIKQQGNKFTWTVINRNQKATGVIYNENDIQVSWKDGDSQGTTTGLILETDPEGKAVFIEWDNGVFFQRVKKP